MTRETYPIRLHVRVNDAQMAYLKRRARKYRSVGAFVRDMISSAANLPVVSGGGR